MDTITHLVMGHAMGILAQGATPAIQTGAYWGALIGNSLPDIDVPAGYLVGKGWAFHRQYTHTVPGVLGLALATAGLVTLFVPGSSFGVTWAWTLLGTVVHIFMDCLNLFGTRPFWPFSGRVIGAGVLFIVDPIILLGLGAGTLANLVGLVDVGVVKLLYGLMWAYVAARCALLPVLRRRVADQDVSRATVVPFLSGWRYMRDIGDRSEYGRIGVWGGHLWPIETIASAKGPVVEASRAHPRVQEFLQRARYPVATVERLEKGHRVTWQDLFSRLRGKGLRIEVLVGNDD